MTFRRLEQALGTTKALLNRGRPVVNSTVWGLLRSYSAFLPAGQDMLLPYLSRFCMAMPKDASTEPAPSHVQSDVPSWEHAAQDLQTQLSAFEVTVVRVAAAALADCNPAALDTACKAGLLLVDTVLGPMFPQEVAGVAALRHSIDQSVIAQKVNLLQSAFRSCNLLHLPNLREFAESEQLKESMKASVASMLRCVAAPVPHQASMKGSLVC